MCVIFTGPILHDSFQLDVLVAALPSLYQVQHMHTVGGLAVLFAFLARQLNLENGEHGQTCGLIAQPDETGVEVDSVAQG
jgi:hypothetical protein